jgi:hypothetical protein
MINQFKKYENFVATLDNVKRKELEANVFFLRTAMICEMYRIMVNDFKAFTDANGHAEFYEITMEICDKVLLTEGSEYLKYIELYFSDDGDKADDYFPKNYDTCMDWFFMIKASNELIDRLKDWRK